MKNPGWVGETGDFGHLEESDVRGETYAGRPRADGGHPGAATSLPYQLVEKRPDSPLLEGPYGERLEKILSRYPDRMGALLPVLNMAQEVRGHLSPETMDEVAERLGLPPAYVRGVATFYTMYNKQPVGDYLIQVCTNVACNLCGADDVLEAFIEHTGTGMGEISEDGRFTVMEVECLGACGFPTAVQINERYFENIEPGDVPAILDRLRSEAAGGRADGPSGAAGSRPGEGYEPENRSGRGHEPANGSEPQPRPQP